MQQLRASLVALLAVLCTVLPPGDAFLAPPISSACSTAHAVLSSSSSLPVRAVNSRIRQRNTSALQAFDNPAEYDGFLGELIFSSNDPAYDVANNFERAADEGFQTWLDKKIKACTDLEERVALSSLFDIIKTVLAKLEERAATLDDEDSSSSGSPAIADAEFSTVSSDASSSAPQAKRTSEEVLRDVRAMQGVGGGADDFGRFQSAPQQQTVKKSVWDSVPEAVRQSYESVLNILLDRPAEQSLSTAVDSIYEKCDVQFLALLKEKIASAPTPAEARTLSEIEDEINAAMNRRMSAATEKLQTLLTAGNPTAIQAAAAQLAREGGVDDALVLLLEGNIQQAQQAGAPGAGAFRVLTTIKETFSKEADRKVAPEKRVLRQCLRETDPVAIEAILKEAFRPRAKLALVGGGESSDAPLVPPPDFINAVRQIKLNFGNIEGDEQEFGAKLDAIVEAAEKVATELYGESMSPQEQQDRAWKEHGASVWELEKVEEEARLRGEDMPWANDKYDHVLPTLQKGTKQGEFNIGGT